MMFNDFHMLRFNVLVSVDWQNHSIHSQLNSTPCSMVLPCSTHMNILMVFCWLWGCYTFSHRKPLVTPGILARLKAQRLSPSDAEMFVSLLWRLVRKTCILCRKKHTYAVTCWCQNPLVFIDYPWRFSCGCPAKNPSDLYGNHRGNWIATDFNRLFQDHMGRSSYYMLLYSNHHTNRTVN